MAKQDGPKSGTVNIGGDLRMKITVICTFRGLRVQDYLDPIVRDTVEEDFAETLKAMQDAQQKPGGGGAAPAG